MGLIPIEDYLQRGPKKAPLSIQNKVDLSRLIHVIDIRNDIENTGKECLLLNSQELNLIM